MTYPPQDHVPGHQPAGGQPGQGGRSQLRCPLCGGMSFQQEESRQDSRWGFTTHRMTLMICRQCKFVMSFYDKHSMWDFD